MRSKDFTTCCSNMSMGMRSTKLMVGPGTLTRSVQSPSSEVLSLPEQSRNPALAAEDLLRRGRFTLGERRRQHYRNRLCRSATQSDPLGRVPDYVGVGVQRSGTSRWHSTGRRIVSLMPGFWTRLGRSTKPIEVALKPSCPTWISRPGRSVSRLLGSPVGGNARWR